MSEDDSLKITLVDDHRLFRKGMVELVSELKGFSIMEDLSNGLELIHSIQEGKVPDIVLLDIKMPVMDGYETVAWIKENKPTIKVLALSMYDNEESILKMLKLGAKGYILKDADPAELEEALLDLVRKGFYYSAFVSGTLIKGINKEPEETNKMNTTLEKLNPRETEFLRLVCTELTYKEIADKMCLAPRTIDGYRDVLFEKLQIKSRTGLVLYAIKAGIATV